MRNFVAFDKWWGAGVGLFVVLFLGWFLLDQVEGVAAFGRLLAEMILVIPTSLRTIVDYYTTTPLSQSSASFLLGATFGAITSALVFLSARRIIHPPRLSAQAVVIGLISGGVVALAGGSLLGVIGVFFLTAFGAAFLLQPEMRDFFRVETLRPVMLPFGRRTLATGLLLGAAVGGLGSQLLAYPMQHCTYSTEAPLVERQLGVLVTLLSSLIFLLPLWTLMQPRAGRGTVASSGYFKGWLLPIAFLAPTLISLLVFLYYPAVQIATLSLRARILRREAFICLENYVDLANDVIYRNSFLTTLLLTIGIVVISMALALGIALLASQKVRGASIYRTLLIWPYAISPVVTGAIFLAMFRQNRSGLINYVLGELFDVSPRWLTDANLAPWVVIFAAVWNALGFNILFYIAGLQNIPKDLLEAAQIDGANRFQRFLRITLPLLSPFTFFLLVTTVTFSFYGIYGAVDTLTQGGPVLGPAGIYGGATNVLIYKLYEDAFSTSGQVGGAAAQSVMLFLLVAGLTFIQFRYVERRVTYGE
ncbi:MAG: sugar ABC transporter permease [bacterium]|nr:sugar ABC transporter permease [bacterium]